MAVDDDQELQDVANVLPLPDDAFAVAEKLAESRHVTATAGIIHLGNQVGGHRTAHLARRRAAMAALQCGYPSVLELVGRRIRQVVAAGLNDHQEPDGGRLAQRTPGLVEEPVCQGAITRLGLERRAGPARRAVRGHRPPRRR